MGVHEDGGWVEIVPAMQAAEAEGRLQEWLRITARPVLPEHLRKDLVHTGQGCLVRYLVKREP